MISRTPFSVFLKSSFSSSSLKYPLLLMTVVKQISLKVFGLLTLDSFQKQGAVKFLSKLNFIRDNFRYSAGRALIRFPDKSNSRRLPDNLDKSMFLPSSSTSEINSGY